MQTANDLVRDIEDLIRRIKNGDLTEIAVVYVDGQTIGGSFAGGPALAGALAVAHQRIVNRLSKQSEQP